MKRKLMLFLTCLFISVGLATAQTQTVTGTVISEEDGQPVVGASVLVKGTTVGTITDMDGKFTLSNVPSSAKTLQVSFIGMQTQEVAIRPNLRVGLKSDNELLDEVIVVAYGTAKKSQFTGSASTISSEKISSRQTSNVTNALAGQVAGVQATNSNGQPGTGSTIRIRGIGSISASNAPLYVVDGVPYDGDIASINSSDIESMTVLKDAASNALYGARGANGVILVTTKKGTSGKATIKVDAKWGTNRRAVPNYNVMKDPGMYYETEYASILNALGGDPSRNEAANSNLIRFLGYQVYTLPEDELLIGENGKLNPNAKLGTIYRDDYYLKPENWYDELFDKGNLRQEYNVNISGSSEKMNYYLSAGYLDDTGIIANSGFTRFSTRLRSDYQVNDALKVGANIAYANTKSNYPDNQSGSSSVNLFYVTNYIAPIYPLYVRDASGNTMKDDYGYTIYDFGRNQYPGLTRPFMGNSSPAAGLELNKREFVADVISAKGSVEWRIIEGLKATANWGLDADNTRGNQRVNSFYGQYAEVGGIVYVTHQRTTGINQQYLLTYLKQFGDHNIDILAGFESYRYKYQYLYGKKEKLYNPHNSELNNAINNPSASSYTNNYATQGILARVQYNYNEKYFGSLSYRRDASSRFHPDNRWGDFGSIGASWLLNKEAFLESQRWIDMLKFKISYGIQGNDNIGNYYAYQNQYTVVNSDNDFAVSLTYKGNKDITWETSNSFNTGFDFEFFKGRLNGTIEYFTRKTKDMLYNRPTPGSNGFYTFPMNVGSMTNRGFEVELNGILLETNDITWRMNFNMTHFKNKINKLHPDLNGELINNNYIYREGESMYQFYLRKYAGPDEETGIALYYVEKDGKLETTSDWSNATRYGTGDLLPKVYGGFGTSLEAYGFDFNIGLAYQLGGKIYDNTYAAFMHNGGSGSLGRNFHKDILGAWTSENKNTNIPRLNYNDLYTNSLSDRFITSSDYLSIQNITVGYTLPKNWTRKVNVGSLRVYMTADNVALFSARKGLDPRQNYTTSGNDVYSPIRSISGGISVQF